MSLIVNTKTNTAVQVCDNCGASAPSNSKGWGRFNRRHPKLCTERREFTKQLSEGVRSVEPTAEERTNSA